MLNFKKFLEKRNAPIRGENEHETDIQHRHFGVDDYEPFIGTPPKTAISETVEDDPERPKKLIFRGIPHQGKANGVVAPRHMWEGTSATPGRFDDESQKFIKGTNGTMGMRERNILRAKEYGSENRDPLTKSQIDKVHRETLEDHFKKSKSDQLKAEKEAVERLYRAGHLDSRDTTDNSEKTDTANFEQDEQGRGFTAACSKGVAGHAVYTSGTGKNEQHHILNTCQGQTEGCGGGTDENGVADPSKGTCFAPKAESQYPSAAIRRATHAQAKHDPAMTRDWILAHAHSMRKRADAADRNNKRFLFRPNVVDESDTTTTHLVKHLNAQRKTEEAANLAENQARSLRGRSLIKQPYKPAIILNSYGKTDELHDPENGVYVTYSNTGPKVKNGKAIKENIDRDGRRVRQTQLAIAGRKDLRNEQGNLTPAKNSYMVLNAKRGSDLANDFEKNVTHAKYWTKGREKEELSPEELSQGEEGHYDGNGNPTDEKNSHYGHRTVNGRRYDYQRQHILHPRLVKVKIKKKKKGNVVVETHHIPTDSRFMDDKFLPPAEKRFKTRNGKLAGGILVTTPTTSTSDVQHHTPFTHHVDASTIHHAMNNNGEYEIDKPEEQEKAKLGGEYIAPKPITIRKKK